MGISHPEAESPVMKMFMKPLKPSLRFNFGTERKTRE